MSYSETVETARSYYNSESADQFYYSIWGGEDIHVGLYEDENDSIADASRKTVERIASRLKLSKSDRVIDLGAGYGGAARHLAKATGARVECLNLSEVQNERNREINKEQGLSDLVGVIDGSFESIPFDADTFDAVWSQDALLHSGNRKLVFQETARVLKSGGDFVFTDPMMADDCPEGVLEPILNRIHLSTMGSVGFYKEAAKETGFDFIHWEDLTHQLVNHYSAVLKTLEDNYDRISAEIETDYLDRMKVGLGHWINGGKNGHLAWGILHFRKK